jgi:hypothetical protein
VLARGALAQTDGQGRALVTPKVVTQASASFRAVVDRILAANRQPSAWEAGCLYAALCELAAGREEDAVRKISLALLPGAQSDPPVTIIPPPTGEQLLDALEHLNGMRDAR